MKVKKLLLSLMVLVVIFSLVACGGGSKFVGEWQSVAIEENGKKYEGEYMGQTLNNLMQLEIKKDSTLVLKDMGFSVEGTWSEKDGVGTFTVEDESINGKIIDKQLVLEDGEFKIYLEKKK